MQTGKSTDEYWINAPVLIDMVSLRVVVLFQEPILLNELMDVISDIFANIHSELDYGRKLQLIPDEVPGNLWYKPQQIQQLKCFSSRLAVVFAQSIKAMTRTKMQLEQHRQAMLQLHLIDQQFYCLLRCHLY